MANIFNPAKKRTNQNACPVWLYQLVLILSLVKEDITNPGLAFNLAGNYAIRGDKTNALRYVKQALTLGKPKEQFLKDSDFASLLDDKDFIELINN